MDARKQAAELAKMGRYGDTMLMHVNPQEVAGLASIMPVTINPQTGQPEAFVGAILGSLLGGTIFPNLLGAGLVGAAGGAAFGSGLGTYLETGDLEKGIASAVLGYGSGQIMDDIIKGPIEEGLIGQATPLDVTVDGITTEIQASGFAGNYRFRKNIRNGQCSSKTAASHPGYCT